MANICPNCNTQNRDGARFCTNCAAPLVTSVTCPACGTVNAIDARFCLQCATPLRGMSPQGGLGTGQLPPNSLLQGRYVIVRRLGQGGMGAVYEVTDARIPGKRWAIKEMSDAALATPEEKQQALMAFQQEAQMLATLSHANLPVVADFFSENGKQYLVMEFVDGETLEDRLNASAGFLDERQVVDWATQICDVLAYLHSQKPPVVFRDLKPGNVMTDRQGRVKLIDFGIARLFKPGKSGDTQVMGTPGYAAPEQYGKGQTDARSDVYSLGVTLHRLMTKYDPANTPFNLPPVRNINPAVSKQTMDVINRATQPDALARFQSVSDMKVKLTEKPKPAPQAAVPQPAPQHVVPQASPRPAAPYQVAYPPPAPPSMPPMAVVRQQPQMPPAAFAWGLQRASLLGYVLTIIVVGGLAGLAAFAASENIHDYELQFRVTTGLTFVAGSLAGLIARRPGAALLAEAVAWIVPMLLAGGDLESQLDAAKFPIISMAVGAELAFLLTGYRFFNLFTALASTLFTAIGLIVGMEWTYGEFAVNEEVLKYFAEQLAVPAAAAGVVAFVIAFVVGKVLKRR